MRNRLQATFISLLGFLVINLIGFSANAKAKELSAEQLFRRYKPAVVKIVIRQQQIPVGTGTGFFVSRDGLLVTNNHVMKSVLRQGSFTADFVLADGTTVRDFKVSACRDERGLDLCILKLPVKPKAIFEVKAYEPSPGETIYAIGHPQGLDFSITNGIVSAVRLGPNRIQELQVTAAISPGNSGGPIFNSRGTLVGVVSKFYKEGQNLNFGIHAREVKSFLSLAKTPVSIAQYRKNSEAALVIATKKMIKEQIDVAYSNYDKGLPISDAPGFKEVRFDFGDAKVAFPIPKIFETCDRVTTKKNGTAFQCSSANGNATMSVSRVAAGTNAPLIELNGQRALKEKPLEIVDLLMQEGSWSTYEKTLSPTNRKYLFSIPGEAKCRPVEGQIPKDAFFAEGSVQCRFSVYNDMEPDAYSYSIWAQRGKFIYDFYVWMEDAGGADYFNHVPSIAVLGARSDEPKPELASLPFSIQTPPAYSLKSTELLSDGTKTFLFSRSRAPAAVSGGGGPLYMVNVLKTSFAKRDLIRRSRELFEGTLEGFDTEMQKTSLRFQEITADHMPGFVQTALAQRRAKNVAVFHATLIDDKTTYMIFAFGDSNESNQIWDDFLKMTLSLKRGSESASH